jgi:hypothetical protein
MEIRPKHKTGTHNILIFIRHARRRKVSKIGGKKTSDRTKGITITIKIKIALRGGYPAGNDARRKISVVNQGRTW